MSKTSTIRAKSNCLKKLMTLKLCLMWQKLITIWNKATYTSLQNSPPTTKTKKISK